MSVDELERLAIKSTPMPEGLSLPEQWLYQAFRLLYKEYNAKIINREQAKIEKMQILKSFESAMLWYKIYKRSQEIQYKLSFLLAKMNKSECELCKKVAKIWTGIEEK